MSLIQRRMMMAMEVEDDEMKEWETLVNITTDSDQTEDFSFEFEKGYKEIAVFFTYPKNDGNTDNKTLCIGLNNERTDFGAVNKLLYQYSNQIVARIETQPFNRCSILFSDIDPKWYLAATNNFVDKVKDMGITEINKILFGSEKKDFIFGAGTTIVIKGR